MAMKDERDIEMDQEENNFHNENYMDPDLWAKLQYHIPLELVFAKLPLREFFQLRVICKNWNRLASDREFLENSFRVPIQKPYFHLLRRGPDFQLHGILTYNSWCKKWDWTSLGDWDDLLGVVALEGLIYVYKQSDPSVQSVFNIHTRVWYKLPPLLEAFNRIPFTGITVDTSVNPYNFRIVQGSGDGMTQIYDSRTNSWVEKDSSGYAAWMEDESPFKVTCAQITNRVYIMSDVNSDSIYIYQFEEDHWLSFTWPEGDDLEEFLRGIGAWKNKVYHLNVGWNPHPNPCDLIMYIHNEDNGCWNEYDRMLADDVAYLFGSLSEGELQILSSFCDQFVLVYTYLPEDGKAVRFIVYNLDTKEWNRVDIPPSLVYQI